MDNWSERMLCDLVSRGYYNSYEEAKAAAVRMLCRKIMKKESKQQAEESDPQDLVKAQLE